MNAESLSKILSASKRPLSLTDIAAKAEITNEEAGSLINECVHEGLAVAAKGGKYAHPRIMGLTLCRARVLQNAPAFAKPLDGSGDFYLDCPEETAFDGDLVFVRETHGGERRRGTLVFVVKRAHTLVTGTLFAEEPEFSHRKQKRSKGRPHFVPEVRFLALLPDRRFPRRAVVIGDRMDAEPGDMCVFEIAKWPVKGSEMCVRVKQVTGSDGDIGAHISALCAMHEISEEFAPETLAEAAALGEDPSYGDTENRLDLRNEEIFTIDGADAKDFDDAVSLSETESGYLLGVHIADVSHYVREGSFLNADARRRGTSVYLPGRTIPMLPGSLSDCLCSLMPGRDRLTLSALIKLDKSLNQTGLEIVPSVIRSKARLTYEDVNAMFAGQENTVPGELCDTLKRMNTLAKAMNALRMKQGSIDLDMPEPGFVLDETGYPTEMCIRTRGDAHRLIEEFMLAANKAVAAYARENELPFPYRVHEKPDSDKIASLELTLIALDRPMKIGVPNQARLQAVIDAFKCSPRRVIVSEMILRSMSKARYSEKDLGHFGLAFADYCHFTSPIRRYPDLLAHRMLHRTTERPLGPEEAEDLTRVMHTLTDEASALEEQAALCERECDKMMCAAYMLKNRYKSFPATVTRFLRKGVVVMLDNCCEGLIPYRNMEDNYEPDEQLTFMIGARSHRLIRLGDRVNVRCADADIANGDTLFRLLEGKKEDRKTENRKKSKC